MNICGSEIDTPWDDRADFSPKWRHLIAAAMVGQRVRGMLPEEVRKDKYITTQYNYLSSLQIKKREDNLNFYNPVLRYYDNKVATKWFDGQTSILRHYIEAMLLTEQSYEDIASIINSDIETIVTYEKLFFNIRDNYGRTCYSPVLKTKFATGNTVNAANYTIFEVWKLTGAQLGYAALRRAWGWPLRPDQSLEVDEVTYQRSRGHVVNRVVKGDIGNFDINNMQANYINGKRLEFDMKQPGEGNVGVSELDAFGLKVIQAFAPKMLKTEETLEEKAAKNEAIQQKFLVQKGINNVQLNDKGPQNTNEEFNQELRNKANSMEK